MWQDKGSSMRYLFGDSILSPVQFDYISAFEAFLDAAVQAAQFERDSNRAKAKIEASAAARQRALESVEDFHREVMASLVAILERHTDPNTNVYAQRLREAGEGVVAEARSICQKAREKVTTELGQEDENKRKEAKSSVETCLRSEVVPSLGWTGSMRLTAGHCEITSEFAHHGKIVSSFSSKATQGSPWTAPVRVAILVLGIEVQVGVRKSWITGSLARNTLVLDDYIVGGFLLSDDAAEIQLRKRADQPDTVFIKIHRRGDDVDIHIERKGEDAAGSTCTLDTSGRSAMERLWQIMASSVKSMVTLRDQMLSVTIEGKDLFTEASLHIFLRRLVRSISPTVQTILAHSPNPDEMSMKIEDDDGRREEIYVRHDALLAKIDTLDEEGQSVFNELGLISEPLTSTDLDYYAHD